MNDRQRLEAIVSVVCKYLPPDGISKDQAMTEIISLVDPLPEQEKGEPVATIRITQEGSTRTIDNHFADCVRDWPDGEYKLYTTPYVATQRQQRPFIKPLTDEQIYAIQTSASFTWKGFARAIEAAHGITKEQT